MIPNLIDFELSFSQSGQTGMYMVEARAWEPGRQRIEFVTRSGEIGLDLVRLGGLIDRPSAYSQALGKALFGCTALREEFIVARDRARHATARLRVRLRVMEDAPELHGLVWELLPDPDGLDGTGRPGAHPLLSANENIDFVRYLPGGADAAQAGPARTGRGGQPGGQPGRVRSAPV